MVDPTENYRSENLAKELFQRIFNGLPLEEYDVLLHKNTSEQNNLQLAGFMAAWNQELSEPFKMAPDLIQAKF